MESHAISPNAHITSMRPNLNTDMWLWKMLSAVAEYMYKTYKRWWLSIKTSLLNSWIILNLDSWILKLMNFFPELIHIAAHLPKVVLRVAEGSTDKEEEWVFSPMHFRCPSWRHRALKNEMAHIFRQATKTVIFWYFKM
jgi:hypothetical protein